ncbi:CIA30 family protein [Mycobacterium antarcticum]|uniref:CIA30 family protein n=1 Tax=Mycolicibacterium sp. TUM20984 TaxID=3023368 RepID=UPI0024E1740D|nr:CIA30 family protein [Mycolicibacterium sp. TUM20984]
MNRHRLQLGLVGILVALLIVSCGSAGRTANADETTNPPTTPSSAAQAVTLVDLDEASEVATWTTVNDPVMGGQSTSRITFGDGGLVFSGSVSLENNGGFASARSPQDPDIGRRATGAKSLRVRALGDGKTYVLKVGTAGQPWSYIQRFTTEAAVQRIYELPIAGFQPVGQRLDPAPDAPQTLDPSNIDQVSVYILDKQQGPFELTISTIDATT